MIRKRQRERENVARRNPIHLFSWLLLCCFAGIMMEIISQYEAKDKSVSNERDSPSLRRIVDDTGASENLFEARKFSLPPVFFVPSTNTTGVKGESRPKSKLPWTSKRRGGGFSLASWWEEGDYIQNGRHTILLLLLLSRSRCETASATERARERDIYNSIVYHRLELLVKEERRGWMFGPSQFPWPWSIVVYLGPREKKQGKKEMTTQRCNHYFKKILFRSDIVFLSKVMAEKGRRSWSTCPFCFRPWWIGRDFNGLIGTFLSSFQRGEYFVSWEGKREETNGRCKHRDKCLPHNLTGGSENRSVPAEILYIPADVILPPE